MRKQMFTISRAAAWKMGIDLAATGKQLSAMRRAHNLSQEELSELFEMGGDSASRVTISNWENGKKLPTLMHAVFLAELYRCSLDELVVSFRRSREAEDCGQPAFSVPCAGFPAIASAGAGSAGLTDGRLLFPLDTNICYSMLDIFWQLAILVTM